MSNFSAIQAIPFCILDLDKLGYSINDLDRCGVQQWYRGVEAIHAGDECYPFDSFTADDIVGSQWPIGLTYSQLVWFYWKPKGIAWDGYYQDCLDSNPPQESSYAEIAPRTFENWFRRSNPLQDFPNCDQDYGTRNDLWLATHIANGNPFAGSAKCGGGSSLFYYDGSFAQTFNGAPYCFYPNAQYQVNCFTSATGRLDDPEFGIPDLAAYTNGEMPRVVKKNGLYWPTFSMGFTPNCGGSGSVGSVVTFGLPYHGHSDYVCFYEFCLSGGEDGPDNEVIECGCLEYPAPQSITGTLVIDGDNVELPLSQLNYGVTAVIPCPDRACPLESTGCNVNNLSSSNMEFFTMTFSD